MPLTELEQQALASLDEVGLVATLRDLLRIPSITGNEAEAQRWLSERMREAGLDVDLWTIDVPELQQHTEFPGMEVERNQREAIGLVGTWRSDDGTGKRLIFNGHIDVVPEGEHSNWSHNPWGAELVGDKLYGRGACDMKGGLIAALYAIKALKDSALPLKGTVLLQSVIGEEDGGLGTFATLLRGHTGDAALICEPTSLKIIPANAGALTFTARVTGKSAHACVRLEGVSAIEKYLAIHQALLRLEHERNRDITHPLLGRLKLPYPLSIGRVQAGNWSSSVPEELLFEGRIGVAMGEEKQSVREQFEQTIQLLAETDPWLQAHPVEVSWTGGQFASGSIPTDHLLVRLCAQCIQDVSGQIPEIAGAPYGSDLRLFIYGNVPALLYGPGNVSVAHMPDEHVSITEIVQAARVYILAILRYLQVK